MKERTKGFVAGFLLCALLIGLGIPVGAATYKKAVEVYYRDIKLTVDSQEVTPKDAQGNKVEPFIMNGTTYLPVRGIASALGGTTQPAPSACTPAETELWTKIPWWTK